MTTQDLPRPAARASGPGQSVRLSLATALGALGRRIRPGDPRSLELHAPALIFAPHPDDEVLGCGGTIVLKRVAGARVGVVVMTDGRTSHATLIDAPALIAMRRAEAVAAARQLGLQPDACSFLDFEDNRLSACAVHAAERVRAELDRFEPAQVFVPHRRDRLPDHVATRDIVLAAARARGKPVTVFEYPVWLWNTWPWVRASRKAFNPLALAALFRDIFALVVGCDVRVDVSAALPAKEAALAEYRSQTERKGGDPLWPILRDVSGGDFIDRFTARTEVFLCTRL